jgi:two-component system sensor histidine kinase RegB
MALRVSLGGKWAAAARARLTWRASPDRWLIRLRWLALIGMLTTTLVAESLVPGLPSGPILSMLAVVAASNLGWLVATLRAPAGRTVPWQLAADVLSLGAVLWLSGGLDNPFAVFLVFQIVLAGLLASRKTTIAITLLVLVVAGALFTAPPLALGSAPRGPWLVRALGNTFSIVALAAVTGAFVVVFVYRLEVLRDEAQRSERLAALGRVVAAMCHELNTPLGTILIAGKDLALLARELPDGAQRDELALLADTVTDQARRASDIIGLLRGHVAPGTQLQAVRLDEFVPRYVRGELERLGYRGGLALHVAPGLEASVFQAALCQILTNLLANAVDAMSARGQHAHLTVEVARGEPGTILITLDDNGVGVDPSLSGRLGEPFQTTKDPHRGTGLGLYASTLLAERMGGALALESRQNWGTRVTLTLREAAEGVPAPVAPSPSAKEALA